MKNITKGFLLIMGLGLAAGIACGLTCNPDNPNDPVCVKKGENCCALTTPSEIIGVCLKRMICNDINNSGDPQLGLGSSAQQRLKNKNN